MHSIYGLADSEELNEVATTESLEKKEDTSEEEGSFEEDSDTEVMEDQIQEVKDAVDIELAVPTLLPKAPDPDREGLILLTVFQPPVSAEKKATPTISEDGKVLTITKNTGSQGGAIWSQQKVDLHYDFTFEANIYLGNSGTNAGDGMTFTLTNDERFATNPTAVSGSIGMGMGAYATKSGNPYVHKALSIEFDTYYNSGSNDRMDKEVANNGGRGHIGIVQPKANNNNYAGEHLAYISMSEFALSNDTWRDIFIEWDAANQRLSMRENDGGTTALPSINYQITDIEAMFGSYEVYWGFTGSTGGKTQENKLMMLQIPNTFYQAPKIKNVTTNSSEEISVEGKYQDVIQVTDYIDVHPNSDFLPNITAKINIPNEITYRTGSLLVDGEVVAEEDILPSSNSLTVKNLDFSDTSVQHTIQYDAEVNETSAKGKVVSSFELYSGDSDETNLMDESYSVTLELVGSIVAYHKLQDGTNLVEPVIYGGEVGQAYVIEPLTESSYVLVETIGNPNGVYTVQQQEVTFIYKEEGILALSVPEVISFGSNKIATKTLQLTNPEVKGDLIVSDSRAIKSSWQLLLTQETPITNSTNSLDGYLYYMTGDDDNILLSDTAVMVEQGKLTESNQLIINDKWSDSQGLKLVVPVEKQVAGNYQGELLWKLQSAP